MDFLTYLAREGAVIWQAPVTFLIAVVLAGLVAFALARWAYATRLEHSQSRLDSANSTIEMLEKRLDRAEQSDAIAIEAVSRAARLPILNSEAAGSPTDVIVEGPREFLPAHYTPDFLADLFENQTSMQAQEALKKHIGKWMTYTGQVRDVSHVNRGVLLAIPLAEGRLLFCDFLDLAGLRTLDLGDTVTVIGRLESANALGVRLEQCELVP
jgi:hypothetical protein